MLEFSVANICSLLRVTRKGFNFINIIKLILSYLSSFLTYFHEIQILTKATFAVNHLSHHLMAELLIQKLKDTATGLWPGEAVINRIFWLWFDSNFIRSDFDSIWFWFWFDLILFYERNENHLSYVKYVKKINKKRSN